ncbi:hypothetical protein BASA81_003392 [Batrachochytrium salamandrivorans]|nr:hypothetical protein BASA81_003392 [Batrachochytrium salamandrivorans]
MNAHLEREVERLESELALVKQAIPPKQSGSELRDFIDANAEMDILAGTSSKWSEWLTNKEQKGKSNPSGAKRGFWRKIGIARRRQA